MKQDKKIRLEYKTYTENELVDLLCSDRVRNSYHQKERFQSGAARNSFLAKLEAYCEYEYENGSKQYKIIKVRTLPLTVTYQKIHRGIYQYLVPIILADIFENECIDGTIMDLAKKYCLINDNYIHTRNSQGAVMSDKDLPFEFVSGYYQKTYAYIRSYLMRALDYLVRMGCITTEEVMFIESYEENIQVNSLEEITIEHTKSKHIALSNEEKIVKQLSKKISKELNILSPQEKLFGKKAKRYAEMFSKALAEQNINYSCKGYRINCIDQKLVKELLRSYSELTIELRKQRLGEWLKDKIDESYARDTKNVDLEDVNWLTSATLLYDAPDVRSELPSLKYHNQQIKDQKQKIKVNYIETRKNGSE